MNTKKAEESDVPTMRKFAEILYNVVQRWETIPMEDREYGIEVARRLHAGLQDLRTYPKGK